MLESLGYREVPERADADLILFNTCSIREKADNRLVGHLGEAKRLKAGDPERERPEQAVQAVPGRQGRDGRTNGPAGPVAGGLQGRAGGGRQRRVGQGGQHRADPEGGVLDPGRHIADRPHPGRAPVPADRHLDQDAVLGAGRAAGRGLVGQRVAHAVGDPLGPDPLDRLHHVDVVAEDEVDLGGGQQPPGQVALGRAGGGLVLLAPVQQHDHEPGPGPPGGAGVGQDAGRVDQVDQPGPAGRDRPAVEPVGVAEQRHPQPADLQDGGGAGLAGVAGRAGVAQPCPVHDIQGGANPLRPLVHGMVGGGGAGVVPGPAQRRRQLRRGVEGRPGGDVPAVARQGPLQVADGEVGPAEDGAQVGEHRAELVGVAGLAAEGGRLAQDRAMGQHVPGGDQGDGAVGLAEAAGRPGELERRAVDQGSGAGQEEHAKTAEHHPSPPGEAPAPGHCHPAFAPAGRFSRNRPVAEFTAGVAGIVGGWPNCAGGRRPRPSGTPAPAAPPPRPGRRTCCWPCRSWSRTPAAAATARSWVRPLPPPDPWTRGEVAALDVCAVDPPCNTGSGDREVDGHGRRGEQG